MNLAIVGYGFLVTSWIILLVRYIQARLDIERLTQLSVSQGQNNQALANNLRKLGNAALSVGMSANDIVSILRGSPAIVTQSNVYEYDIPDAFRRRKSLSEILEFENPSVGHQNDYWVAIELPARRPLSGAYFICGDMLCKATFDYSQGTEFVIVKSVPGTNLDELVELTK